MQSEIKTGAVSEGFLIVSELTELYERLKPIFWIIKVTGYSKRRRIVSYASGFSIKNDGSVITCAHILSKLSNLKVEARSLNEDDFTNTDIVFQRPSWDLALLKVGGINGCKFGELAADGSLFEGETLMHMGNPGEFVGSFLMGRAAYKCVEEGVTLPSNRCVCFKYISTALAKTPPYRIMGDAWNYGAFKKFMRDEDTFVYEKNLHPLVPVIQCAGLTVEEGCSGGPIFNTRGEIVGMLVNQFNGYEIAVHVTCLRQFLKDGLEQVEHSSLEVDLKGKRLSGDESTIF